MLRMTLLGIMKFISESDEAIDHEKWDKRKKAAYFLTDFELPPILPGQKPTIWELRQLTGEEKFQVKCISAQYTSGELHPETIKYIIQRCVVGWTGIETVDEAGNTTTFERETKKLDGISIQTDTNYYELQSFFAFRGDQTLAGLIYGLSVV